MKKHVCTSCHPKNSTEQQAQTQHSHTNTHLSSYLSSIYPLFHSQRSHAATSPQYPSFSTHFPLASPSCSHTPSFSEHRPFARSYREGSKKAYLHTHHWQGKIVGTATLQFCLGPEGWCWRSIVATFIPETNAIFSQQHSSTHFHNFSFEAQLVPLQIPTGSSFGISEGVSSSGVLEGANWLTIKAPWEKGLSFRAGGVAAFSFLMLGLITIPYFGPLWHWLKMQSEPCGMGTPGFWYAEGGHYNENHHAVDFVRYTEQSAWPGGPRGQILSALGEKVLAVADGWVSMVIKGADNGDPAFSNFVLVDHWDVPPHSGQGIDIAFLLNLLILFGKTSLKGVLEIHKKTALYRSL